MTYNVSVVEVVCPSTKCGITVLIAEGYDALRRKDHKVFYCPNGHEIVYPKKPEQKKRSTK